MSVNLSSTTPTAPVAGNLVTWQEDASGNVSAYYKKRKVTLAPSGGVVTIDASITDVALINVTANVTSVVINNPGDGQELTILWAQDATGHTVATPAILKGFTTPSTTANTHSCQCFSYNSGDTNWYAEGAGSTGM